MGTTNLKLYLISQFENTGYDTFDSAVVVAETENDAREILPASWASDGSWTSPCKVNVEYLGDLGSDSLYELGDVVISSFNAG